MNLIEVKGGTKFEKECVVKVVDFCLKVLLPKVRTLEISVAIKKIKDDSAVGYCMMGDNTKEYEIEVAKGQSLREFVSTITHEMVHVKQYYRKEMNDTKLPDGNYKWKNETICGKTPYQDLPWEKEAYELQDELADKIWHLNVI